jgi:hypothetical protein
VELKGEVHMKIPIGGVLKRFLTLALAVFTVFGMSATGTFAAGYSDTQGHWGESEIAKWSEYDVLHGNGDGTFAPDRDMSVAELATVLANTFGYTEVGSANVSPSVPDWATSAVRKAIRAGAISQAETGLSLTRELAAKIIANALSIEPVSGASKFADDGSIAANYKPYVKALGDKGVFNGDASGNFMPQKGFTRAEIRQVLDNTVTDIVRTGKAASSEKSIIVNKPGVSLTAGTIKGDLIIGQGVGEGDITLTDVKVEGRLIVYGGGSSSLHIRGASNIPNVLTNKTFGAPVRIAVEGTATVGTVSVVAGSDVAVDGNVAKLEVVPVAAVTESGAVETAATSDATTVEVISGEIGEVSVVADGVTLAVSAGATVTAVTIAASDVSIEGAGKVTTVTVESGEGVAVSVPSANVTVSEDAGAVSTGDGKTIDSGTTGKSEAPSGSGDSADSSTPSAPSNSGPSSPGNSTPTPPDRSDKVGDTAEYKISVSHMAGLTFVVVEPKSGVTAATSVVVNAAGGIKDGGTAAGSNSVTATRQAAPKDSQYRAVFEGTYGLTEISVTIN